MFCNAQELRPPKAEDGEAEDEVCKGVGVAENAVRTLAAQE